MCLEVFSLYGFDVLLSSADSLAFNASQSLWLPKNVELV